MKILSNTTVITEQLKTIRPGRRALLVFMATCVIFVMTYLLILPALTLDKKEAAGQGGIDTGLKKTKTVSSEMTFDGKGFTVTATAGRDAKLPEGTKISATEITSKDKDYDAWCDEALKAMQEASLTGDDAQSLASARFYDISLISGGREIEPAAPGDVKLSYDEPIQFGKNENIHVIHFTADDKGKVHADVLDDKAVDATGKSAGDQIKVSDVTFEAPGFSVYAVIGNGDDGPNARMALEFYGADGNLIETMYVKNSDTAAEMEEIIHDPGAGTVPSGLLFVGWAKDTPDYTSDTQKMTIADIRTWAEAEPIVEGDEPETVKFYAMIFKSIKVTYLDQDGISLGTHNILLPRTETSTEYTVNMAYTPPDDIHNFEGWNVKEGGSNITGHTEDALYTNGQQITIRGDVTFSVNSAEGQWLIFDENGKGATYNAPEFVKAGQVTSEPSLPMVRNGYTFGGWYEDADCTVPYTFGQTLTDRKTIYAKWNPVTTSNYTVVIWKQNVDATDYDFVESITLSGPTNTPVSSVTQVGSGDDAYARVNGTNKQYEGFHLKEFDQNVTITPEGNAIVNVYYDRNEYTLRFFYARTYQYSGRTYVQVNCNNEGFLQGRRYNRNLNDSLTYSGYNDYQLLDGSNTWKDVNNTAVNGNPLNLISDEYLAKEEVTTGTLAINNVTTNVIVSNNNYSARTVNTTYYYLDVKVRYEQSLDELWPVPNTTFSAQTMTGYNRGNTGYTTIYPLLQGSWATGNNISGKYSTMNPELFVGNDRTAYFITYWRYENPYTYRYNVYFSALEGEAADTSYHGTDYVYQNDKSYTVANGQGWKNSGAPTDSGAGYWDVGTVTFDGTDVAGRVDVNNGVINVYYDRKVYNIDYYDGIYVDGNGNEIEKKSTELIDTARVVFDEDISSYNVGGDHYYTPPAQEGYVFEGWYTDSEGQHPYTFTRMPQHDIKVYAKWRQVQYRVFLHPNAGTDPTLTWGSEDQEMNFRVSLGGKVSLPTGLRTGYEMVGWYTDPACTQLFSGDTELNEQTVTESYDKTTDLTDPMDSWGNLGENPYNSDLERPWITKKLNLYAKWRRVLTGASGIGVVYDANGGENAPRDGNLYLDTAQATAQAAPTAPENQEFKYWVLQTWNEAAGAYEDTTTYVYPGDTFAVLLDNARQERADDYTEEDPKYTYTVQLRAEYVDKEDETPTHIYWYANNGTGDVKKDIPIKINQAVQIRPADTFSYPGYKFLGWARVDETVGNGQDMPDLTEADLFLIYDEETDTFKVSQEGSSEFRPVSQVAADERKPYHDMYAVWEPILVKASLLKTRMDDSEPLPGASFTLYEADGETVVNEIDGVVTPDSGRIDLGQLESGTYYLHEDAAPSGFNPLEGDITITVAVGNEAGHQIAAEVYGQTAVTYDADTEVYTITVPNNPGVELPSTGGAGTTWIYLIGAILLLGCGTILIARRRIRGD